MLTFFFFSTFSFLTAIVAPVRSNDIAAFYNDKLLATRTHPFYGTMLQAYDESVRAVSVRSERTATWAAFAAGIGGTMVSGTSTCAQCLASSATSTTDCTTAIVCLMAVTFVTRSCWP